MNNSMKLNRGNQQIYKYVRQVERAILGCNGMGLSVEDVEFYRLHKPRIWVSESPLIHKMLKEQKAVIYGTGNEGKRYWLAQMNVEGIKVVCKLSEVH